MSIKEKEIDDYPDEVFASEEAFFKRFRIVEGDELAGLKRRIAKARAGVGKSRVTIYFDSDIIARFKEKGAVEGVGYQTLMNEALRNVIKSEANNNLKEDILRDKKFLKRLKTALSA